MEKEGTWLRYWSGKVLCWLPINLWGFKDISRSGFLMVVCYSNRSQDKKEKEKKDGGL